MSHGTGPAGLWVRLALTVASALAVAAAMPGPGFWPLAFVGLTPWAFANELPGRRRDAFAADYAWGVVFFGFTVFWLWRITWIAFLPVLLLAPLFVVAAGFLYRRLRRRVPARFALPLAWLAGELVRSSYPFRFPWGLYGSAGAAWLDLAGLAAAGGPWILTVFFAFTSGALLDLVQLRGRARMLLAVVLAGTVAAAPLAGRALRQQGVGSVEGPLLACVQPNIPQAVKDAPSISWDDFVRRILTGVQQAARGNPDLVLLPETIFPAEIVRGADPAMRLFDGRAVREHLEDEREALAVVRRLLGPKPWLLTGVKLHERTDPSSDRLRMFNSALLFDARNREIARYDKRYLVPGGEELVLLPEGAVADWFRSAIDPYTQGVVPDLTAGTTARVFDLPAGSAGATPRAGLAICYDNAFPNHFRDAVLLGANFHVVLSNEGWFPGSFEMDAMVAYTSLRAIETGRAVVRCTNTGISCLVEPDGRVSQVLEREGRRSEIDGVLTVRPRLSTAWTPYVVAGDAPAWSLAILGGLVGLFPGLLPRRRSLPASSP